MKRIITGLLVILITLSLTACGSPDSSSTNNVDTTASATKHK